MGAVTLTPLPSSIQQAESTDKPSIRFKIDPRQNDRNAPILQVRRAALKHLALVVRRDKQCLADLVLGGGGEVDPVISRLLTGLLELSTGEAMFFFLFLSLDSAN